MSKYTMNNQFVKTSLLAAIALALSSQVLAVEDMTNTLPNAKPGECYAKVMVPAEYRTETQKVVVREASEKVDVVPAKYETAQEKVLVSEASTKLIPVPAVYGTEVEKIETSAAYSAWVSGSLKSDVPVNPAVLTAAGQSGVNLQAAAPNECYHEHYQPAEYKSEMQKVLASQESQKVSFTPAEYKFVEEKVLVAPASKKLVEVPAEYETLKEKVLVEAAKSVWKAGRGPVEKIDNSTGEIMCLVEVPAVYKTVSKTVLKTPAGSRTVEIPAKYETVKVRKLVSDAKEVRTVIPAKYEEVQKRVKVSEGKYIWHALKTHGDVGKRTGNMICKKEYPATHKTVKRRVVKTPATFTKVAVPAIYADKEVRKLVSDAREVRTKIPEETKNVSKRIKVSSTKLEWKSVLCETNMSNEIITNVQQALKNAGFNPGVIDGVIGRQTLIAVDNFQRKNNLATGGLTLDTLKALNVSI